MDPNTQPPSQPPQPTVPPESQKTSVGLIILITTLVLVTIGAAVYLFLSMTQQSQEPDQNYIQVTVEPTASPTPEIDEEIDAVDLGTDEADFDTIQDEIDQL